jgi:tyrosine-protein phosphatase YwqE
LHPVIQDKFDVYLNRLKPTAETKSICIQVRIGGARPNVEYDREITPRNFSKYYWDFVKETFIKKKINGENYIIFVTADMESVEREAMEVFGSNNVLTIDGISAHVDRENGFKKNCTRFEKIIMDFYMLGYCDMALVSDSGFGIFGILRNKIPDENFYVLTALYSEFKKPEIFFIKDFIYANPHRF